MNSVYISQGQHAVGRDPEMVVSTILGSCISICLWDPVARVGGMNHLLLPDSQYGSEGMTAGAVDMDLLINKMMPLGAERPRLRAKLFGGSSMLNGRTEIGARNAEFGRNYLRNESIPCDAENVGGPKARRLKFWPATGIARMRLVEEEAPEPTSAAPVATNGVELF
ncbi:MAG: chemotaxis protein CheD [Silicimonas sp.]|jgi:chemotaxis protein CheD|nr:chemotaxis protein CheD [Silicimonas sp.]